MNREQLKQLEADLWSAADNLRANSDLKSNEYSTPVLGLIFLKFADNNYRKHESKILEEYEKLKGTRREKPVSEIAIEKCGFFLPDHARYKYLLELPEKKDIAKAIKNAMSAIEEHKPELEDVLPQDEYFRLTRTDTSIPKQLLKTFADIPDDASGDMFGQIYEYFLGNFAMAEIEEECGVEFEGRIANKRERRKAMLVPGWRFNGDFQELWNRIQHKTRYAVAYETGDLVRETKSTKEQQKLRQSEWDKIRCGKAHFDSLDVDFDHVTSADEI